MSAAADTGRPKIDRQFAHRVAVLARGLALAYLLALVVIYAALRLVGERWWLTTVALYLPQIGWALPLPFVTVALLLTHSFRFLLTQLAALLIILFPLMGLCLSGSKALRPGVPHFRVLTINIGLGGNGTDEILDRVRATDPDLVVLEEVAPDNVEPLRAGLADYASFQALDQFVVASKFPLDEAYRPPEVAVDGRLHSRHYVRFRLTTPAGPVRLFAVHPLSPHDAFDSIRGEGLRGEIATGRVFQNDTREAMVANTNQRMMHVRTLAEDAACWSEPVLIAGDTNLPGPSWARARWLGGYQDAFSAAGLGFGYTYPAQKMAWMRIDRILVSAHFRVLAAATVPPRISNHLPVMADLELPALAGR
ncbi:MAG: endonuclease/exonuclease/phosphatase family protein [Rudaea sp.]|uniref:endonuclease/exonuclease/phosphatase family protein n=1 Tax=Rudaea sp. TaxID=2136325 RepID=UPI0039E4A1F4